MEMYKGYWEQRHFGLEMAKNLMRGFEGDRREPRRRGLAAQALVQLVVLHDDSDRYDAPQAAPSYMSRPL